MGTAPEFPAFIKLQYGGGEGAKSAFVSDVEDLLAASDRKISQFSDRAKATLDQALRMPRTATGGLDLGVQDARLAAQAAQARAIAAREVSDALVRTAAEERDNSLAMKQSVLAAQELAAAEERTAATLQAHARISEQVQARLNSQASAVETVTAATNRNKAANDNSARSMGSQRAAFINFGQQLQDVTVQLQGGAKASTVFAQQVPQMAFALSGLEGSTNKTLAAIGSTATFMAGPWGAAIFAATAFLGPFIGRLFDTASAAEKVEFASSAMGNAQSILGGVMDMTTGKITHQSTALMALAQAQLLVAKVQAQTRAADARRGVLAIQDRPVEFTGGGLGGGFTMGRRQVDARDTISAQVLAGTLDGKTAVQRLENLRKAGVLTDEAFTQAATAVANLGVEIENGKIFDKADALLNGTGGRDLLKPKKGHKPKAKPKGTGELDREKEAIARINSQWDAQPKLIDQAAAATRELDRIIANLSEKHPLGWKQMIADAQASKQAIAEGLQRPFEELTKESERRLQVEGLITDGRVDEAKAAQLIFQLEDKLGSEAELRAKAADLAAKGRKDEADQLQRLADLWPAQSEALKQQVAYERARTEERRRQQDFADQQQQRQLQQVTNVRSNLVDALTGLRTQGLGSFGNLASRTLDDFTRATMENMVDKLFGSAFQDAQQAVIDSNRKVAEAGLLAARALGTVAQTTGAAAGTPGGNDTAQAASVLQDEILVMGRKLKDLHDPRELLAMVIGKMAKGIGLSDEAAKKIGDAVGGSVQGAAYGQIGSQLVLGSSGGAGSMIGGAFGDAAFKKLAPKLFKSLGDFAGPLGSIAGGILGGLLGGLFSKAKTGGVSIGMVNGAGAITGTSGNNGDLKASATQSGNSINAALANIAERLGASIGNYSVAIGQRKDEYRVSASGSVGNTTAKKTGADIIYKGKDAEAAARAALTNAIQDGAIQGISASAQRLLQKYAADVDKAVNKVLSFEGVARDLKAIKDPVGAALDDLNKQFQDLKNTFAEAGASAAEYAQLEELYGLKRKDVLKQVGDQLTASLQSLYSDLTVGNDALSLRDRKAAALDKYSPLAARVSAGDTTAYNDYADAARVLLGIERELSGSTTSYFDRLNEITKLSGGALAQQQALIDAATASDSPFSKTTTAGANDNQAIVGALDTLGTRLLDGLGGQLDALNINIGQLIANASGGGGSYVFAPNYAQYF